ncbi:DsbA family oxidoreductase [Acinetobacter radioresistens]|uniref:DsbA family oxidoreductase n=1 Tax=Acinetobacter radioresistens TaxID=40216 RepID=UPI002004FFEF|nr:DsbA family oxidoreductase [Acinetobacter radioresistens]MCK4108652.1 DsbA family oxidoreductase [Acinetobacter radioresistens]
MRVDIWSDVVCPFCYIGKKRLESAAEQAGVELEVYWHSYELDPEAPVKHEQSNTERLAQKYGRTVEEMEEMQQKIAAMAAEEGIEFNWKQANSGNTFDAHRIIHLAQSKGLGNQAEEAFFYTYMTQGLAIGERETVEDVAARIGLDAAEVEYVLDTDTFADFVQHDEKLAREQLKVTGVPFFVFDQRIALAGAQPRDVFIQVFDQVLKTQQETSINQPEDGVVCTDENYEIPDQK